MVLEFLSKGEGLDCFLQHVLPKLSKKTDIPQVSKTEQTGNVWICPKLQNDQFENLYTSSHGEARNINFGQWVNIIEMAPLGTPPQAVVILLAHNHVTDLFHSVTKGLLSSNLGSKSNSVIEVDRAPFH